MPTNPKNNIPRRANSRSRTDIAYEYICEKLTSGAYMPSDVIDVSEIVKTLHMSRQPIMTALQKLCIEELVQIIPQVGCIAAAYSHNEWHDLHRLFSSGEALIAEIAAERRTDQEILSLQQLLNDCLLPKSLNIPHTEIVERYRQCNFLFYEHIHDMARSPIIDRQLRSMWNRIRYHYNSVMSPRATEDRLIDLIKGHIEVCDAINNRDAKKTACLTEQHLLKQFADSEKLLDQTANS